MSRGIGELLSLERLQQASAIERMAAFRATVAAVDTVNGLVQVRRDGATVAETRWRLVVGGALPAVGERVTCEPIWVAGDATPDVVVIGGVANDRPRSARQMALYPNAGATTVSAVGIVAPVLSGTRTAQAYTFDGSMLQHFTDATINAVAGVLPPAMNLLQRGWNPRLSAKVNAVPQSDHRAWVGMFASDPALFGAPTFDHAGFLYDSAYGPNWQTSTGDGSAAVRLDSGVVVSGSQRLEIDVDALSGTTRFWIDGVLVKTTTNTPPRYGVNMGYALRVTAKTANARRIIWGWITMGHR